MHLARCLVAAVLAIGLAAPLAAGADDAPGRDLADIRQQQLELRAQARAEAGLFENMTAPERRELIARQSRLLSLIEGKQDLGELDGDAQVEAFNLLEAINATITRAESQKMVCETTQRTGSHRKEKVCMTVAERDRLREDSRAVIEKARNGLCFKDGVVCGFGNGG